MPEQADSFHVRCDRTGPVVEWLEKARALGLVLPQKGTLVTVCVPEHHLSSVIAASHFMMIYYEYLDGERVTVRLYDGAREVTYLERTFEGKLGTSTFDPKPWITHRFVDRGRAKALERGLRAAWPERSERHWVADALGLHDVAWTTGEDLMTRRGELVGRFPGSILVQAGDPVLDAERRPYRVTTPPAISREVPTVIVDEQIDAPVAPPAVDTVPSFAPPTAASAAPPSIAPPAAAPDPADATPESGEPIAAALDVAAIDAIAAIDALDALDALDVPDPPDAAPAAPVATPGRAPTLSVLDDLESELAEEVSPAAPAAWAPAPAAPAAAPKRHVPTPPVAHARLDTEGGVIDRPALIEDLPITDEFESDPPPPLRAPSVRRPTGPVRAPSAPGRGLVLIALTKQRQAVLQDDPRLIEALLEARFEETIPGLLDLGARANDLAALLANSSAVLVDALRAPTAKQIPGTDVRIADRRAVVRIAALLRTVDIEAATRAAVGTYRLAEDLRDLIKLYTEAAQRGNAMLIAFD